MIICLYLILLTTTTFAACVPPGNVFPFPTYGHDDALAEISNNLTSLLDGIIDQPTFNGTTFSIALTTLNSTFFQYHHAGDLAENSTQEINGDSVYRIAGNTKVFAVLLLFRAREQGLVNMDDPITKHIPELQGDNSEVRWDEVTLRSLSAHLGGTTREGGVVDLLSRDPEMTERDPTQLGLPPRPPLDQFPCNSIPGSPDCSEENLLNYIKSTERSYHVWDRPTYSNVGFSLIGLALARVHNTTINDLFMNEAFTPANMTNSSMTLPSENGVIPNSPNEWNLDFGESGAFGGQYSSSNDFMNFHRALLNGELLPISVVNQWLKPVSYTGPLVFAYGAPWEIFNFERFTSSNRTVNMYTKWGTLTGYYSAQFILPDYGVGGVILTAGPSAAPRSVLLDAIASSLIPQLEDLARKRANENYAGEYRSNIINSSLVIAPSETGPGMEITSFISNGTDLLAAFQIDNPPQPSVRSLCQSQATHPTSLPTQRESTNSQSTDSEKTKFMLYPTDTFDTQDGDVYFRWIVDTPATPKSRSWSLPSPPCFNDIAGWAYGGETLTDMRFRIDNGTVISVSLPGFRIDLLKQSA